MTRLTQTEHLHRDNALGKFTVVLSNLYHLATLPLRPTTITIYNTVVNTDNWTAVTTGLTGVLGWKLRDREGQEFDYAFEAAPTPYMTTSGELQRDTEISAVYVKRRTAVTLNMQLEVWTA